MLKKLSMMKNIMSKYVLLEKKIGETPLECLNRYKKDNNIAEPMTYAGRLDPMASGVLIALIGEECKKKDVYNGLDKEYEFEILAGFYTDTHDILGLIQKSSDKTYEDDFIVEETLKMKGKMEQQYPSYSSRTIDGKQMHYLAKNNMLKSMQIPSQNIEIFNIEYIDKYSLSKEKLIDEIIRRIQLVNGDFRQEQIINNWENTLDKCSQQSFNILKFKMKCSAGTYVRGLVRDVSLKLDIPLCVWNIRRTRVFNQGGY